MSPEEGESEATTFTFEVISCQDGYENIDGLRYTYAIESKLTSQS